MTACSTRASRPARTSAARGLVDEPREPRTGDPAALVGRRKGRRRRALTAVAAATRGTRDAATARMLLHDVERRSACAARPSPGLDEGGTRAPSRSVAAGRGRDGGVRRPDRGRVAAPRLRASRTSRARRSARPPRTRGPSAAGSARAEHPHDRHERLLAAVTSARDRRPRTYTGRVRPSWRARSSRHAAPRPRRSICAMDLTPWPATDPPTR